MMTSSSCGIVLSKPIASRQAKIQQGKTCNWACNIPPATSKNDLGNNIDLHVLVVVLFSGLLCLLSSFNETMNVPYNSNNIVYCDNLYIIFKHLNSPNINGNTKKV